MLCEVLFCGSLITVIIFILSCLVGIYKQKNIHRNFIFLFLFLSSLKKVVVCMCVRVFVCVCVCVCPWPLAPSPLADGETLFVQYYCRHVLMTHGSPIPHQQCY